MFRMNMEEKPTATHKNASICRMSHFASLLLGFAIFAFLQLAALGSAARAQDASNATTEVKATVDQVLQILKDPEYQSAPGERRRKLRELIGSHFDFADMSRSALGYHWKTLTDEQRQQFTSLFTHLMEASYMGKIESYHNQQIQYLGEVSDGPGYAQVNTQIIGENQQPISVNYRLRQENGTWKVYDVVIDGISLVANYRNQFNRVINTKGYDALIQEMQNKETQLQGPT